MFYSVFCFCPIGEAKILIILAFESAFYFGSRVFHNMCCLWSSLAVSLHPLFFKLRVMQLSVTGPHSAIRFSTPRASFSTPPSRFWNRISYRDSSRPNRAHLEAMVDYEKITVCKSNFWFFFLLLLLFWERCSCSSCWRLSAGELLRSRLIFRMCSNLFWQLGRARLGGQFITAQTSPLWGHGGYHKKQLQFAFQSFLFVLL